MTTQSDTPRITKSWVVLLIAILAALLSPLARMTPAHAEQSFDQKMLELVNQHRAAAGVAPVQLSPILATVAGPGPYLGCGTPLGGRANDMGARNYFSHTILGCNQSISHILNSIVGLVYTAAGENIAWMNGTSDPLVASENLMSSLMNSPGHRANILDSRFTHVGIGSWTTPAGQTWSGAGSPLPRVWIAAQVFAQMPLSSAPAITATPSSVNFGERTVGTTGTSQTVTVKNTGSASLTVSGTSITGTNGTDFSVESNSCGTPVAAGASCALSVRFTPGAAGARSASLSVSHNAAGGATVIGLGGTGTAPLLVGAPTNVVATGGDGVLNVSWTAPTSGAKAVGYGIWLYDGKGYTGKFTYVCGTCNSAAVTGVANGAPYYVAVYGYDGSAWGLGAASNGAWVLAVPGAPTNLKATAGAGSLTVTWTAPATPGAVVDGYGVFLYDARGYTGKSLWIGPSASATFTGLTKGESYTAVVLSHNLHGWGGSGSTAWVAAG